jgi:hypothetical protein
MKPGLFITILLTFSCCPVIAQNGASIKAMGYWGPYSNIEAQLGLDYKINRFSLGTGISYFTSVDGTEHNATPFPNAYNYDQRYIFRHVIVPLNIGYHIPVGSRFHIIPMAIIGISYNTSVKYMTWEDYYANLYERKLSRQEFDQHYRRISLWAGLALRFSYHITDRLSILASFQGRGTITPINKNDSYRQRSSSISAGAGFQYSL